MTKEDKLQLVTSLRTKTGIGVLTCNKILIACEWDINKAIEELKKNKFNSWYV